MRDFKSLIACLLMCISATVVSGQDPDTTVARYINFEGYSKSNHDFLRTNVDIEEGDAVDFQAIQQGLQNLKNTVGIAVSYTHLTLPTIYSV